MEIDGLVADILEQIIANNQRQLRQVSMPSCPIVPALVATLYPVSMTQQTC